MHVTIFKIKMKFCPIALLACRILITVTRDNK